MFLAVLFARRAVALRFLFAAAGFTHRAVAACLRALVFLVLVLATAGSACAQQFHRQDFEGDRPALKLGLTDAQVELVDHSLLNDPAQVHSGKQSERVVTQAKSGTFCFLEYPLAPSLIFEELSLSAWVYANRPGVKLAARVVLPRSIDPDTKESTAVLLKGDVCEVANRWRRLMIRRPDQLLAKQQELLQAKRRAAVDLKGAYVDMLLFDIHTGIGETDVRIDDIQAGPLVPTRKTDGPTALSEESIPANLRTEEGRMPMARAPAIRDHADKSVPRVNGDQILLGGRPFFFLAIRHSEAPLATLRQAGINTLFLEGAPEPALAREAEERGLELVPPWKSLAGTGGAGPSGNVLAFRIASPNSERSESVLAAASDRSAVREPGGRRPLLGEMDRGLRQASQQLDIIGASRDPLFTSLDFDQYFRWLSQRKQICRPGAVFFTGVQTHAPTDYLQIAYGHATDKPFDRPIGPEPEQVRLLAYAAVSAGCRGIVYSSDRALSEMARGRARMLEMALVNLELSLVEPFLAAGKSPIPIKTSNPNVHAVVFTHERGRLVVAFWKAAGAQYVVGQAAINDLNLIVESVPESAQAYQISLAEVRGLKRMKDLGGVRIVIPEFDLCAMVLLTTDMGLIARYQEILPQISASAAAWSRELAETAMGEARQLESQLSSLGKSVPRAASLFAEADSGLAEARSAAERRDHRSTILAAARGRRMVRLLEREYWSEATKGFAAPVTDPFLVSVRTLPEHYLFQDRIRQARFSENKLPTGDFEREGNLDAVGWVYSAPTDEGLAGNVLLVGDNAKEGRRALEISLASKDAPAPTIVERARVAMTSPAVPVQAGQVARISGQVRLPKPVSTSTDGVMIWDSLGGETLALRITKPGNWQSFSFVRPVRDNAELRVHLALTGLGQVYFDDLKVELGSPVAAANP